MAPCTGAMAPIFQTPRVKAPAFLVLALTIALLHGSNQAAFNFGKQGSWYRSETKGRKLDKERHQPGEQFMSWSASRTGVIGATPAGLEYKRKKAAEEVEVILTAKFLRNHTVFSKQRNMRKYGWMNGPTPVTTPYETAAEKASQALNGRKFMGYKMHVMTDASECQSNLAHFTGLPPYELSDPETMIKFRRWVFTWIGELRWVSDNSGTVRFSSIEDLRKALDMTQGSLVEGRKISVAPYYDDPETTLHIRGLHPKTRGKLLFDMFSQVGEVVEAEGPGDEEPEWLDRDWHMDR